MKPSRRQFIGTTAVGIFGALPIINLDARSKQSIGSQSIHPSYPSTDTEAVKAVVGAAHTKLDVVKELVMARPELAKATYDWGFGDVESALGAASHMGRKDIAEFLIEYGARPNIFTYAMLGKLEAVKSMITDLPAIAKIRGPHGFTLLFHANMRLRRKNVEGKEKEEQEALVKYLENIEGTDISEPSGEITPEEQESYLGKYVFGDGDNDYFEVSINKSMNMLSLARGNYFGRVLKRIDSHTFAPGGAPSVKIIFTVQEGKATALTIHDPLPIVTAKLV